MEPTKKTNAKKIVLIAVVIVVIVAAIAIFIFMNSKQGNVPSAGTGSAVNSNAPVGTSASGSATRLPTLANVVVPDEGATSTGGVAVPQVESAAAPGVSAKYRSFNITLQNGAFTPSVVAVNLGDTVNLEITAVDGNYDFTQPDFGFNATLPEGQNKTIQFAAMTSGKFVFYCSSCGGPTKGPVGYIIIAGK